MKKKSNGLTSLSVSTKTHREMKSYLKSSGFMIGSLAEVLWTLLKISDPEQVKDAFDKVQQFSRSRQDQRGTRHVA